MASAASLCCSFNLLLAGRSTEKLDSVMQEVKDKATSDEKIIVTIHLAHASGAAYDALKSAIADVDINGVPVNNVRK
ncbi:hypothetical protein FA95DRAFT_1605021 [Auriscalpium vulgare]|uniref:Uncharacterized protein n=1 Tax=Auriscalpium vulgare TaxID=40419 RepID=A0ACB8RXJ1_9AGAM|nr:hypothetical protein FA95DRAFT_1605021 [Auriscalpium vulgare]